MLEGDEDGGVVGRVLEGADDGGTVGRVLEGADDGASLGALVTTQLVSFTRVYPSKHSQLYPFGSSGRSAQYVLSRSQPCPVAQDENVGCAVVGNEVVGFAVGFAVVGLTEVGATELGDIVGYIVGLDNVGAAVGCGLGDDVLGATDN